MKHSKFYLITVVLVIFSTSLFSQEKKKDEVSPESRANEYSQWMISELSLNDDQAAKVREVNKKMFKTKHDIKKALKEDNNNKEDLNAKLKQAQKDHNKALKEILVKEDLIHSKHNLFYTAAKIERDDDGYELRMVDKIVDLLRDMGMQVDKFTADENKDQRKYLIDKLSENYIDGLVAIKCLDEGVDIPSVERAFILASSSNPKEFIQRRGRVLRQSKATGKKYAYIYDFIVIPNPENANLDPATYKMERNYLEKEFLRFQEFAEIAENVYEIEPLVYELKKRYNLLHV